MPAAGERGAPASFAARASLRLSKATTRPAAAAMRTCVWAATGGVRSPPCAAQIPWNLASAAPYADTDRASIAPEKLMRALLLQVLY